jgi:1-phosphofructokinase family hexose kinase
MILTITPNTGIDQTLFIPSFHPNRTIRALESHLGMGGKGVSVSWILGGWGEPNLALGFAAGSVGKQMEEMLHHRQVQTDFVWVDGSTRWNTIIVCLDESSSTTITTSTLKITPQHLIEFQEKFSPALAQAACLVLSGTTPQDVPFDFYPHLITQAKSAGVPVILDSSGPYLRAGLTAGPWLIKPNRHELEELVGETAQSNEQAYSLARQVQRDFQVNLIVSLGQEGAFALIGSDHFLIPPINVKVVSAAGAGDAVMAGIAISLARKLPIEDGLRLSFALATAMLLTPGTGDFNPEDARRLLPQVKIQRLPT